jgi:hypothetical protein
MSARRFSVWFRNFFPQMITLLDDRFSLLVKVEWYDQEGRTIMHIPLDPESKIVTHGDKN